MLLTFETMIGSSTPEGTHLLQEYSPYFTFKHIPTRMKYSNAKSTY
jgi:hypothetical protein